MTKDAATLRQEDYKFKAAQQGLDTNKIKSYPSYQSKMPVEQMIYYVTFSLTTVYLFEVHTAFIS